MRDCILSVLWPRQDIVDFFRTSGCTKSDLKTVVNFKTSNLSRAAIVDGVFAVLATRPDEGLGAFRAMLHALINWSHFDSYFFDKLKKLDRGEAQRQIDHLKQLQEIRDAKIKENARHRQRRAAAAKRPTRTLNELRDHYLGLASGQETRQRRGYLLEKILSELGKLAGLEITEAFRVEGEQIDGAIKYDGEHYIVEARWRDSSATTEAVYQFAQKVEGKMYGRGLFVSINGYQESAIDALTKGKAIRTVFVDGEDIILVLERQISFVELLDRKIKAAQTKGRIYVHPISGVSKVK